MRASRTIFLSGEPIAFSDISLENLGVDVFFTTTRTRTRPEPNLSSDPRYKVRVEYLPVFSSSFSEMASFEPSALLAERGAKWAEMVTQSKSRGVGYLYYSCRPDREAFFHLLRSALTQRFEMHRDGNRTTATTAEALGLCSGRTQTSQVEVEVSTSTSTLVPENALPPRRNTRFQPNYLEDAIAVYKDFKFVIAYEHEIEPGYITEKLTNAFLAAAVPIYIGAGDVTQYFNPDAMVTCSKDDFSSCIAQVIALLADKEKYIAMLG